MARPNKSMRQIKEILRLKFEHQLSIREIASSCAVPASIVGDYLKRAELAGLSWPLPEEWTDEQILERLLGVSDPSPEVPLALPDWAHIHEELRRKSVTLRLLWQEYRQTHPEGYGYSRFCELYERWAGTLDRSCARCIFPAKRCLLIVMDRLSRSTPRPMEQSPPLLCLWPCWGPATKRLSKPSPIKSWPAGLPLMSTPTDFSVA